MTLQDAVGWVAAALTLLTFSMQSMVTLRVVAVLANFAFITYGMLAALTPVLFLHLLLLPCNLVRLTQLLAGRRRAVRDDGSRGEVPGRRRAFARGHAGQPQPGVSGAIAIGAVGTGAGTPAAEPNVTACACADADCEAVVHVLRGRVCVRWGQRSECMARAETGELLALPPRSPRRETGAARVGAPACLASPGGQQGP